MPSTLKYKISYPAGTVAPNVPVVMQTAAESVETALKSIEPAAPVVATMANSWTAFGAGYEVLTFQKVGRVITVTGLIKPGTISAGVIVANIPTGMVPTVHNNQIIGAAAGSVYSATTVAQFASDGTIKVFGIPGGTSYLMFNNTYLVPA